MAGNPSYDAFIAQLERKHQVEASGHNSYFEVFNEASRLIGQLKKGLNASIHRERQSEVRVAAQSWQDSYYNARADTGSGVDILDWQPRYAHLDLSEAGDGAAAAAAAAGSVGQRAIRSAAAASPTALSSTHQRRRSNTSPPVRRHGHAAAAAAAGEPPSPSTAAAAAPLSAGDRAASEPLTPSYRPGLLYNGGGGGGAAAGPCPGSPRLATGAVPLRGRRATDSLLTKARRGSAAAAAAAAKEGSSSRGTVTSAVQRQQPRQQYQQQQQQQQQGSDGAGFEGEAERGEGGGEDPAALVLAVRERSFLGSPGQPSPPHSQQQQQQQQQQQRLLPPLDEPSGPLLCSPTSGAHGGSRVDEAIRVFARTAYEPGEHRQSLLLLAPTSLDSALGGGGGGGGSGGEGSDPHHLEPLPLAPVPRAVPRHVTEALSSLLLLPPALNVRSSGALMLSTHSEGGGGGGGGARFAHEPSLSPGAAGPDVAAVGGRPQPGLLLPPQPPSSFHPQPPEEPLNGPHPRPQGHRIRPSAASSTAPMAAGGTTATAAAAAAAGGRSGGSDRPSPPPQPQPLLLPGRGATRRVSACGPWDSECPNSPASPARVRAAAAAAAAAPTGRPAGGAPPSPGMRAARESYSGAAAGGAAARGAAAGGGAEAARPLSPSGLIKGYATVGGGPLDYRALDVVPRLGLDAPRVKAGGGGVAAAGGGGGAAAAAGLSNAPHHARPGTAQGGGADQPSPTGRFARSRRASCTGVPTSPAAAAAVAAGNSSGSISLGPMLITREQVDSYVTAQAQAQAQAQAAQQGQAGQAGRAQGAASGRTRGATGSARPGPGPGGTTHNVIGTRGCLTDEPGPQGPRTLRREVATLEAHSGGRTRGA